MVRKDSGGKVSAAVETTTFDELPPGDVLIRVRYSSLNYKDALAARAHPGVAKRLPHVPGIDAAGTVETSTSDHFKPGDQVVVTGHELGAGQWGGWAAYVRVPANWVVALPQGITLKEAMTYGTAGFTAAQALRAVIFRGIGPERGEVVVTGATGGVGSFAVALFAKAGYHVAAVTGKASAGEYLKRLGASRVLARGDVTDTSDRPLLTASWAAAVDTVWGNVLAQNFPKTGIQASSRPTGR
jgi:putative YhdH/YhfP family quinone oxidoreductase